MNGFKMETILISGINGFLGSNIAKRLSTQYNIIGLEHSTQNLYRIENYNFQVYSSNDNYEHIFIKNQIFAVIHAATVYRRNNTESIESLITTNIILPIKLYELADKYGCKLFLNTDSFFNNSKYKYRYLSDYILSKKQVLEWLRLITKNCKLVNMKIFHMYGPDDSTSKFIPEMIITLKSNIQSYKLTGGNQIRDFIYIDDVVNAFKIVLEKNLTITNLHTEFEVGTGIGTSIKDLILLTSTILNSKTELLFGALPYRENEIMHSCAENSKLLSFGWSPRFNLLDGIKQATNNQ